MKVVNFFRMLNRKRIIAHRVRKLKAFDRKYPRNVSRPSEVKRASVLIVAPMFGDSMFVAGLIKKLVESGVDVAVFTKAKSAKLFDDLPFLKPGRVFGIDAATGAAEAIDFSPDVLVDLEYASNRDFEMRASLERKLDCCCLCTAPYLKGMRLYDGFIDIAPCRHESERMAKIFNAIVPSGRAKSIGPFCHLRGESIASARSFVSSLDAGDRQVVYFNAVARKKSSMLSNEQATECISFFKKLADRFVFVCNGGDFEESGNVRRLPKTDFNTFCAFLSLCDGAITPDTAVVHAASAFDVPVLVFYPGNSLDPCRRYLVSQVWAPTCRIHMEYAPDTPGFCLDRFGYPSAREIYIREIACRKIVEKISDFLKVLPDRQASIINQ
jgi:hypothetical protein